MQDKPNKETIEDWLDRHDVQDVEILVCDLAGVSRGKKLPRSKFLQAFDTDGLRLPESLFGMTVDCDFITNEFITDLEVDVYLDPEPECFGLVPWLDRVTAFCICDIRKKDGSPFELSPRQILKNVVALYAEKGWRPVVAPEFEFSLLTNAGTDDDALNAAAPPTGRSGRAIVDKGVLSIDGMAEFSPLFDVVRQYCEAMGLPVDALVQEAGIGQFEFNVGHNAPTHMADVSFHFKRLMKWAAVKHGLFASFMAKPYADDFGNSMHIHQSVVDTKTGANIFADENGRDTALFRSHIAGIQKYAAALMPLFAPYSNSYLRLNGKLSSPVNTHWGIENRSVGLRIPESNRDGRRVENRIAGSDCNPYLGIGASLLCGYLGMVEELEPSEPVEGSGYSLKSNRLPEHIYAALDAFEDCTPLRAILGDAFVTTFIDVKRAEIRSRSNVISPWDMKYLLTNV